MNELFKLFPEEEEFQNLLREIQELENMPVENFDEKNLKERKDEAKRIKVEVKQLLDIGIENENIAQSEMDNYQSRILADLEEMLADVKKSL